MTTLGSRALSFLQIKRKRKRTLGVTIEIMEITKISGFMKTKMIIDYNYEIQILNCQERERKVIKM